MFIWSRTTRTRTTCHSDSDSTDRPRCTLPEGCIFFFFLLRRGQNGRIVYVVTLTDPYPYPCLEDAVDRIITLTIGRIARQRIVGVEHPVVAIHRNGNAVIETTESALRQHVAAAVRIADAPEGDDAQERACVRRGMWRFIRAANRALETMHAERRTAVNNAGAVYRQAVAARDTAAAEKAAEKARSLLAQWVDALRAGGPAWTPDDKTGATVVAAQLIIWGYPLDDDRAAVLRGDPLFSEALDRLGYDGPDDEPEGDGPDDEPEGEPEGDGPEGDPTTKTRECPGQRHIHFERPFDTWKRRFVFHIERSDDPAHMDAARRALRRMREDAKTDDDRAAVLNAQDCLESDEVYPTTP